MTPRREQREVQLGDGSEASGYHIEVPHVSTERDGDARGPFEEHESPADEGEGVAGADVGDGSKDVGQ